MHACQECSNLFHISVASQHGSETGYERVFSPDEQRRFEESAESCQLCRLISIELGKRNDLEEYDEELTIWTKPTKSKLEVDEGRISSIRLALLSNGQRLLSDVNKYLLGSSFDVWTDRCGGAPDRSDMSTKEGMSSFDSFVDWHPATYPSLTEISSVTQRLLDNCLNHHSVCRLSVTELQEEFELPSRVISIQDDAGVLSAKLLETKGLKGTYCALSHCWGEEDKRPLKTTQENITSHLASIPWSHLPSTFRDALSLVSELGLKYLWIDSLCIIQDDKEDWKKEAMKMASVYRKAVLVIAAANSEDSTEGLLGPQIQLPPPLTFRCPITVHDGSDQAIRQDTMIQISTKKHNYTADGPLRERAWVFQEWYLGRRKVFFTSLGICWKCNHAELDPRGETEDLGLYETSSWLHCLTYYSEKKLTVPSDRIIALHGIAEKLKEDRDDSFATELGVWEDGLAEQLLWKHEGVPRQDFPGLPSWCWAATGGGKDWVTRNKLSHTVQNVSLGNLGSLDASGMLIKATTPSSCLWECCLAEFLDDAVHEFCMRPGHCGETDNAERFLILDDDGTRILGVGIFDDCECAHECFCFILTFEERDESDPFYYISESGSSGSEMALPPRAGNLDSDFEKGGVGGSEGDSSDVHSTDGSDSAYLREDDHACVDLSEVRISSGVYWSLLLQPVDDTLVKFRRVGMALIWPRGLTAVESEVKRFEIV